MPRVTISMSVLALFLAIAAGAEPSAEPFFATLEGKMARVSEHRGKVVVLNFWATWCGPCRTEMPVLTKLHADLESKGLHVIAAAADGRSEGDVVRAYMRTVGMTFDVWLWASAADMRHYGVGPALPATIVIDRAGVVRSRFQGVVTDDRLRPVVAALLAEPAPDRDSKSGSP